jgi:hypothetical protein
MFMKRISVAVLCLAVLASAQSPPDPPNPAPKDPQAVALAQRALAAMGAVSGLLASDSLATGTLTLYGENIKGGNTVAMVLKTKGRKLVRVELQRDSGTTVRILNDGQGTIQRPDGTVRHLLMNNTFGERVSHIPALSLLAENDDAIVEVEQAGQATVSGQPADLVALSVVPTSDEKQAPYFRSQTRTTFWVDQMSSFVTKMQYVLAAENDSNVQSQIETIFSDYRNVKGLWVPFHQSTYADGNLESDLVLTSVEFNVGLSDSEFALPQVRRP